jgi:hypothetical protein
VSGSAFLMRPVPYGWVVEWPAKPEGRWTATNHFYPGVLDATSYDALVLKIERLEESLKPVPDPRPDPADWMIERCPIGWQGVSRLHERPDLAGGEDGPARAGGPVTFTEHTRGEVLDAIGEYHRELREEWIPVALENLEFVQMELELCELDGGAVFMSAERAKALLGAVRRAIGNLPEVV